MERFAQPLFIYSKSMERPEQWVKSVQSSEQQRQQNKVTDNNKNNNEKQEVELQWTSGI